ncbi:ISYps1 transposase [Serratia sp. FS14]|nr:ISYps1 transposase [Serratia sp. FS14]
MLLIRNSFKRLHYPVDVIAQCVRWYLAYRRDAAAALRFFRKAIRHHGEPEVVTIDKSDANTAALTTLNVGKPDEETITVRQSKYLNNLVEQDHRNIKRRTRPMLGLKSFRRAQTVLAGIELIHMIRKG